VYVRDAEMEITDSEKTAFKDIQVIEIYRHK